MFTVYVPTVASAAKLKCTIASIVYSILWILLLNQTGCFENIWKSARGRGRLAGSGFMVHESTTSSGLSSVPFTRLICGRGGGLELQALKTVTPLI
jgi:hypothetical protein